MTKRSIDTADEVLALANVINPGGHRLEQNGAIKPGLEGHETNCAFVAVATAAFLQDGTQVAAPSAPSALLINGNDFLVKFIASLECLGEEYAPRVEIVTYEQRDRFYDDEEFQRSFGIEEIQAKVNEITSQYPGHSFLVHGRGDDHHWFNITPEGNVIDVQVGQSGENLLSGQLVDSSRNQFGVYDGTRRFTSLDIYPVDKDLSGKQLIKSAEGLHQFNSMVDLARYIDATIESSFTEDALLEMRSLSELIDAIVDPFAEQQISIGVRNSGDLQNALTSEWFNEFCNNRIDCLNALGVDAQEFMRESLERAILEGPNLETKDGTSQTWLSEATFREPGSVERAPSVVEHFAGRCPLIAQALDATKVVDRTGPQTDSAAR